MWKLSFSDLSNRGGTPSSPSVSNRHSSPLQYWHVRPDRYQFNRPFDPPPPYVCAFTLSPQETWIIESVQLKQGIKFTLARLKPTLNVLLRVYKPVRREQDQQKNTMYKSAIWRDHIVFLKTLKNFVFLRHITRMQTLQTLGGRKFHPMTEVFLRRCANKPKTTLLSGRFKINYIVKGQISCAGIIQNPIHSGSSQEKWMMMTD